MISIKPTREADETYETEDKTEERKTENNEKKAEFISSVQPKESTAEPEESAVKKPEEVHQTSLRRVQSGSLMRVVQSSLLFFCRSREEEITTSPLRTPPPSSDNIYIYIYI